jgi:DNA-binding NarL/FixJ family response regulator
MSTTPLIRSILGDAEMLTMISRGLANDQIARSFVSARLRSTHVDRIMMNLDLRSRVQASRHTSPV